MAVRAAFAAATCGALAAAAVPVTNVCSWSTQGTKFDLSAMKLASGATPYTVADVRHPLIQYTFNICGDVQPPAAYCTSGPSTALAWQTDNTQGPMCYNLGWQAAVGWNFTLSDPARPARGVVITYPGGDSRYCSYQAPNRTLSVELQCAPVPPKAQYTEASVVETDTCNYKLTLKSIAGCPTSCVTGTNVCSGNGICGFDTDSQSSRCFCYTGYQGGTCGEGAAASGGMSAEGIILIVVCIVLAGVLGVVAFMMLKLRKLQVDPAAYGELQGRFNELGMLA